EAEVEDAVGEGHLRPVIETEAEEAVLPVEQRHVVQGPEGDHPADLVDLASALGHDLAVLVQDFAEEVGDHEGQPAGRRPAALLVVFASPDLSRGEATSQRTKRDESSLRLVAYVRLLRPLWRPRNDSKGRLGLEDIAMMPNGRRGGGRGVLRWGRERWR